jgi:HD-GYP domain-containing protein (c-di-GMP phosphodiesterase class II)
MQKIRDWTAYAFGMVGLWMLLAFTIHTDRRLWVPTFVLCLLTTMIDLIPMRVPDKITFSFNSALFIVAILQYDVSVAMVAGAVELCVFIIITRTKFKYLSYNFGNFMVTAYLTNAVWKYHLYFSSQYEVCFIFLTLITYMILNSFFASFAMKIFVGKSFWQTWFGIIRDYYQIYLVTEIIGLMFASLLHSYGLGVIFIVTIFLVLFYSVLNKFYRLVLHERNIVEKLKESTMKMVLVMAAAVDARDPYTHGHSTRVALYARRLANTLQLTKEETDDIYYAGLLHDIGKIGVRDSILRKPGALSHEELMEMQTHPVIGEDILKRWGDFERILPAVRWHHERYDGKGYPDGLAGAEIPFIARLLSVCDAFDAMTSDRPYRKGMPIEKALSIILAEQGKQFDPELAVKFVDMISHMDAEELHTILTTEREAQLVGVK